MKTSASLADVNTAMNLVTGLPLGRVYSLLVATGTVTAVYADDDMVTRVLRIPIDIPDRADDDN